MMPFSDERKSEEEYDCAVVGGGLAGLVCALRLASLSKRAVLLDQALPQGAGKLGGFAKFSGAKFSYLPAGQGLIPLVGSTDSLRKVLHDVSAILGIASEQHEAALDLSAHQFHENLRLYHSVVLTEEQMDNLLEAVATKVEASATVIRRAVSKVTHDDNLWRIWNGPDLICSARLLFCAGGRIGSQLLQQAGAKPQPGRGIDVGVRVEFMDAKGTAGLRSFGPDAKLIRGRCRTFCLNSPGKVYRYPFGDISIAGGIVAPNGFARSNFGILCRLSEKMAVRDNIISRLHSLPSEIFNNMPPVAGDFFGETDSHISQVYGSDVLSDLHAFARFLGERGLVDWQSPHVVHFPLLDWHWDTYAIQGSHRTTLPNAFAIGDAGGHARGLLQAAASGWIAANEATSL